MDKDELIVLFAIVVVIALLIAHIVSRVCEAYETRYYRPIERTREAGSWYISGYEDDEEESDEAETTDREN